MFNQIKVKIMKRLALFFTVCAMSLAQSCCAGVSAQSNFDNEFVVKVDEKSTFPVEFYSTITMETSELTFSDVILNLQNSHFKDENAGNEDYLIPNLAHRVVPLKGDESYNNISNFNFLFTNTSAENFASINGDFKVGWISSNGLNYNLENSFGVVENVVFESLFEPLSKADMVVPLARNQTN